MKLMRFFILQSGGVTDKDTAAYRSSRMTEIEEETSAVEVYLSDSARGTILTSKNEHIVLQ